MAELIILSTYKSFILNKNSENKVSFFILKACIINAYLCDMLGFPGGSVVKNLPAMRKTQVRSWVGKIPWRRKWQPTLVFLPGKSHGQRLVGYNPWGRKELDTTELSTAAAPSIMEFLQNKKKSCVVGNQVFLFSSLVFCTV